MQVVYSQSNVAYDVAFVTPSFQLAKNLPDILAVFYGSLGTRFGILPKDMEAFGGSALSDVRVRIRLFNDFGTLELFVDRFSASFRSIRTDKDFELVQNCIELGDAAVRSALPDIQYKSASIRIAIWGTVLDGAEAANKLVLSYASSSALKQEIGLGLEFASTTTIWKFRNHAELWTVEFLIEPSIVPDSHLYLAYTVTFDEGSTYASLQQRLQHCRIVLKHLLKFLALETAQSKGSP